MPAPEPARDADLKGAMECKVRVEALVAAARKSSERRQLGKALGYWSEQQRTIGARLGKDMGQMLADELIFGLTEASNPNWRRAVDCVRSAVVPLA